MFILLRLFFIAISLYLYLNIFLYDFNIQDKAISNKIYLFLFIFIINFLYYFASNLFASVKISINDIIEISINNALLSIIAYGVYNDLFLNGYFLNLNYQQQILMLILLIISFITSIKILQLLLSNN